MSGPVCISGLNISELYRSFLSYCKDYKAPCHDNASFRKVKLIITIIYINFIYKYIYIYLREDIIILNRNE